MRIQTTADAAEFARAWEQGASASRAAWHMRHTAESVRKIAAIHRSYGRDDTEARELAELLEARARSARMASA